VANLKLVLVGMIFVVLSSFTSADLSADCYIASSCGADTAIFSVSSLLNAHAAQSNSISGYFRVCCPGADLSYTTSCSDFSRVLLLNKSSNSHVESNSMGYYSNPVCLGSNPDYICNYKTSCSADQHCIVSISKDESEWLDYQDVVVGEPPAGWSNPDEDWTESDPQKLPTNEYYELGPWHVPIFLKASVDGSFERVVVDESDCLGEGNIPAAGNYDYVEVRDYYGDYLPDYCRLKSESGNSRVVADECVSAAWYDGFNPMTYLRCTGSGLDAPVLFSYVQEWAGMPVQAPMCCSYKLSTDPGTNGLLTNAHVSGCSGADAFSTKVCCGLPVEGSCELTSVQISSSGDVNEGNFVQIDGVISGDCSSARNIVLRGEDSTGNCTINLAGGKMRGINGYVEIDSEDSTFSSTWVSPSIHADCFEKLIDVLEGAELQDSLGSTISGGSVSGSFRFVGALEPPVAICGDGVIDALNGAGVEEECEFLNPFNFDPSSDPHTCSDISGGEPLIGCSYDIPGAGDCGECIYDSHLVSPPGTEVLVFYGDCIDTPPLGDGFGEKDMITITGNLSFNRVDAGWEISRDVTQVDCQILSENVPFFDWINFSFVLILVGGYYAVVFKKKRFLN
jgi:hypothetical protein